MAVEGGVQQTTSCPECGAKTKPVGVVTVHALLKTGEEHPGDEAANRCCVPATEPRTCSPPGNDTGFRFCSSPECDVVYCSDDRQRLYRKADIRVPVGVKEQSGPRPLCYCFGHSVESIKAEIRSTGQSTAPQVIREKMKDPGCRCETENPSGSCCLGSVTNGIRIAQEELEQEATTSQEGFNATSKRETVAKMGTVISAVMASSCCWLPLVLLAFGVSGAGIASMLEAWRPAFIALTVACLGFAFYLTYRPRQSVSGESDCCSPETSSGSSCSPLPRTTRWNMSTVNKTVLWVVTVFAVAFLFFPSYVGLLMGTEQGPPIEETMRQSIWKIDGMTCEGCSVTVEKALRGVPGVLAVEVRFEKSLAVVGTEPGKLVPKETIRVALREAGYNGSFLDTNEPAATHEQ